MSDELAAAQEAAEAADAKMAELQTAKNETRDAWEEARSAVKDFMPDWNKAIRDLRVLEAAERARSGGPPPQQVGG
jgi:hypothetical protein